MRKSCRSVIRRLRRSDSSKVFWSRTERMLRPRRSWIVSKTTFAALPPSAFATESSSSAEPGECGRSETRSLPAMPCLARHRSSHSSRSLGGTSVCTPCWNCVEPLPIALVVAVRPDTLMSVSGRTATTKAMGKGSTQFQHGVQTEVPPKLLEEWLDLWRAKHGIAGKLRVSLRPHSPGSALLELSVANADGGKAANVVFDTIQDRRGRSILSVRDQNTFDESLRRKRLMTLLQLFLIHRYRVESVHYLTPTEDNHKQTDAMKARGLFRQVTDEVGEVIVADVDRERIAHLLEPDKAALKALIAA